MKLKIEHLVPYLPYGLELWDGEREHELIGLDTGWLHITIEGQYGTVKWADVNLKPLLWPCVNLDEPIIYEGKELIPLIEIAKLICPGADDIEGDLGSVKWNNDTNYLMTQDKHLLWQTCDEDGTNNKTESIPNHYTLFNKLFEWHIDVFGLIPKGLALSKAELSK